MDEIGLFPLGLVLLPTEQVPLHIFEPRYRELIGESLERGVTENRVTRLWLCEAGRVRSAWISLRAYSPGHG